MAHNTGRTGRRTFLSGGSKGVLAGLAAGGALTTGVLTARATGAQAAGGITDIRAAGAVGDGVTDDAAAINRAAAGGGALFIPPGRYRLGHPLVLNRPVQLLGAGPAVSRLEAAAETAIHIDAATGVAVHGLGFTGDMGSMNTGTMIRVTGARDTDIADCAATNAGNFVVVADSTRVHIRRNHVQACHYGGIVLDRCRAGRRNEWIRISENHIENAQLSRIDGNAAIQCRANAAPPWHDRHIHVLQNQIVNAGIVGIGMDGCDHLLIQGNRVVLDLERNGECIAFCGESVQITDNDLFNAGGAACCLLWAVDHAAFGSFTRNVVVANNIMDHNGAAASQCVALVTHGDRQVISSVVISGNLLHHAHYAIQAYTEGGQHSHGLRDILVTGNIFTDLTGGPVNIAPFPIQKNIIVQCPG